MSTKKSKDGYVLKSDVKLIIQNYIRSIQMNDSGNDNGIPQLYAVMKQIEKMPVKKPAYDKEVQTRLDELCQGVPFSNRMFGIQEIN